MFMWLLGEGCEHKVACSTHTREPPTKILGWDGGLAEEGCHPNVRNA